jgi:hypothetical protein
MMGVAEDVIAARIYGVVRCGLSSLVSPSVPEVAREFGLFDEVVLYKEIDKPAARRVLQRVLHRDMAYNGEVMAEARAVELAEQFLAQFRQDTRYYTNGSWHMPSVELSDRVVHGASWDPVTTATFDTGILAIGPERSGCLWIEDED